MGRIPLIYMYRDGMHKLSSTVPVYLVFRAFIHCVSVGIPSFSEHEDYSSRLGDCPPSEFRILGKSGVRSEWELLSRQLGRH